MSGAKYIAEDGQLLGLLAAAGGGEGEQSAPPNPLLGASALRTLGKVLAKAARVDLEVRSFKNAHFSDRLLPGGDVGGEKLTGGARSLYCIHQLWVVDDPLLSSIMCVQAAVRRDCTRGVCSANRLNSCLFGWKIRAPANP